MREVNNDGDRMLFSGACDPPELDRDDAQSHALAALAKTASRIKSYWRLTEGEMVEVLQTLVDWYADAPDTLII